MTSLKLLLVGVGMAVLSGCASQAMILTGTIERALPASDEDKKRIHDKYLGAVGASKDNVEVLQELLGESGKVAFNPFTSTEPDLRKLYCRLAVRVKPPRGLTYAGLVEDAIVSQFKAAGKYSPDAPLSLSGTLTTMTLSAPSFGSGSWGITLEVVASNGKKAVVSSNYEFDSAFGGKEACARAQESLIPAVDRLVGQLLKSPDFAKLVR